jgi:hypothetical protein
LNADKFILFVTGPSSFLYFILYFKALSKPTQTFFSDYPKSDSFLHQDKNSWDLFLDAVSGTAAKYRIAAGTC